MRTSSDLRFDRNRALLVAAEQARLAGAFGAAVAEREAAAAAYVEGVLGVLAMRRRDHEAVFVVGDRHDVVHVLDLGLADADLLQRCQVDAPVDMLLALIGA